MTLKYWSVKPSNSVKDVVRFYWFLEGKEPYTHYSMADVCPELIFHYHGQFHEVLLSGKRELSFLSGISAPSSQTRKFSIDQSFGMFGIYLFPHAIPTLFDIPANELTNYMVDLDSLGRKIGTDLEDQIMMSTSAQERIGIIESFIIRRLQRKESPQLPVIDALKFVMQTERVPKVRDLTNDYFLSERQLERQFQKFTGFAPKQFIRISRFRRAINSCGNQNLRLTDIALDCGYYDQSHFINDFKQFSGLSPKDFFKDNAPAAQWRNSEVK